MPGAAALAGQLLGIPVCVVIAAYRTDDQACSDSGVLARGSSPVSRPWPRRESTVASEIERHGYELIHPFDNWQVIAKQGDRRLGVSRPGRSRSTWSSARSAAADCSGQAHALAVKGRPVHESRRAGTEASR